MPFKTAPRLWSSGPSSSHRSGALRKRWCTATVWGREKGPEGGLRSKRWRRLCSKFHRPASGRGESRRGRGWATPTLGGGGGGGADAQTAQAAISSTAPAHQTTGLRKRGNDTSKSTGRSSRQKAATRRNMRREERVTVQGPVKEQQPDGMSHGGSGRGLGGSGRGLSRAPEGRRDPHPKAEQNDRRVPGSGRPTGRAMGRTWPNRHHR